MRRRREGHFRYGLMLLAAALVATSLAWLPSVTAMDLATCSPDASDSDGDGFGWEPDESLAVRSCIMAESVSPDPDCDYSQAGDNRGWGWNPITRQSCEPLQDVTEPTAAPIPLPVEPAPENTGACPTGWPQTGANCDLAIADFGSIAPGTLAALPIDDTQNHTEQNRQNGGFRTRCFVSNFSYADPLVVPGEQTAGGAHLHMFFGNTGVDANSVNGLDETVDGHLIAEDSSTCGDLGEHNRSAYWVPALFNNIGEVVIPTQINVYYKTVAHSGSDAARANESDATGVAPQLVDMRTIPNDLQMISDGGKINIEQRDGKLWLIARVEFDDCIRTNPNGSATGSDAREFDRATGSNYDSFKDWNHLCDNSNVGASIPGLEFNIQWEIQGTNLQFENGVTPPGYEAGNNNRLAEGDWTFSNGLGWDDVVDDNPNATANAPWKWTVVVNDRSVSVEAHPELQPSTDEGASFHGDYMAAWVGNDSWNTQTGSFDDLSNTPVANQDAMSQLRISNQQPVSSVFDNEFDNLETLRFNPQLSTGSLSDGSTGGVHGAFDGQDNYVVDALRLNNGAAIPCEIGGPAAPAC